MAARTQGLAAAKRAVAAWKYPIGTPVLVTKDDGTVMETRTRSPAEILAGHTAVIWLEGISGCFRLDRVRPVTQAEGCQVRPEAKTALPSFFIGEPEIKIPNSRQPRLIAVVEESEHQGHLDPIPHLIRWANARGYSAIANRHRYIGQNRCQFELVLERQRQGGEPPCER